MAITAFLDPTKLPNRTQDQSTFDTNIAAYYAGLPTLLAQINATAAGMNSVAFGGAYAIPTVFTTSYVGNHNGGHVLLSLTPQNTATSMALDGVDTAGNDWSALLLSLAGVTSATKGTVRIIKQGDPTKFLAYRITSINYYGTYGDFVLVPAGSSSANPFAHGDTVILQFTPNGDKGDNGSSLSMLIREVAASGTNGPSLTSATWNQRVLNTLSINDIPGASLGTGGTNTFRLPAGKFIVWASAPGATTTGGATLRQMIRLYNRSSGTQVDNGGAEVVSNYTSGGYATARPALRSVLSLSGVTDFSIDHYVGIAATGGLPGSSGSSEIYTEVLILKVA